MEPIVYEVVVATVAIQPNRRVMVHVNHELVNGLSFTLPLENQPKIGDRLYVTIEPKKS